MAKDHAGVRYGKIVGVSPTDKRNNGQIVWKWVCDCGVLFEKPAGNFIHRKNGSCPDCAKNNCREATTAARTTHGMSKSREYKSWCKIKERCLNPNDIGYQNYGGAGVEMFSGWQDSFELFFEHIGRMPDDGCYYSCDRIDNDKGYAPGNVRWATRSQQNKNKTKYLNNTSGVTGVRWEDKIHPDGKNSTRYAIAQWHDLTGKLQKKSFSVKKYGEELAFFLACEKRDLEIMKLNLLGAEYSANHGK